jgi:hypothetical protein
VSTLCGTMCGAKVVTPVEQSKRQHESKPRCVGGLCLHWPHDCCYGKLPQGRSKLQLKEVLSFQTGTFCPSTRGLSPGGFLSLLQCAPHQRFAIRSTGVALRAALTLCIDVLDKVEVESARSL